MSSNGINVKIKRTFLAIIIMAFNFFVCIKNVYGAAVGDVKEITAVGITPYTVPASGYYKLEVWGAQGGGTNLASGGYGGYSVGVVKLRKDDVLYVDVGGQGSGGSGSFGGGNNGGGAGYAAGEGKGASGGGATHIATENGALNTLSSKKDSILIVAGGGGGAAGWQGRNTVYIAGAHGGGATGNNGNKGTNSESSGSWSASGGGNQGGGGSAGSGTESTGNPGGFGYGGASGNRMGGGGGGGYYGGGGGAASYYIAGSGAGGSGYIGNEKLLSYGGITKSMFCYACNPSNATGSYTVRKNVVNGGLVAESSKTGNGAARITINRLTDTDARMRNIVLSSGSWNEAFDPDKISYDIVVGSEDYNIIINPAAILPTTTISYPKTVELKAGVNTVEVIGTADSGDTKTYTLNITRPASSNPYLKDIKVDDVSIIDFNPETLTYTYNVNYNVNSVKLEAILGSPSQKVYLPSDYSLKTGTNIKEINVVSEDGQNNITYKIIVNKAHTSLLKSLTLEDYSIDFTSDNLNYNISIPSSALAVVVNAVPYDEEATVKTSGFGYIKESGRATITVTEPNTNPITYTVNITKEAAIQIVTYDFKPTGTIQTFTVPASGFYQLEVWGAQGGSSSLAAGGYGAYATGLVNLRKDDILYIGIGGQGNGGTAASYAGGFNGGGASSKQDAGLGGSGGGATHIATENGLLSTLSGKKDSILIVAGGGGGAAGWKGNNTVYTSGGHGGGYVGNNGNKGTNGVSRGSWTASTGGTQSAGGGRGTGIESTGVNGGYGAGGTSGARMHGGGGGGFFGGGGGAASYYIAGGGAGGSSYIGNSKLVTYKSTIKSMYCYGCSTSTSESTYTVSTNKVSSTPTSYYAKSGAGYAKITYLESASNNNFLSNLSAIAGGKEQNYTPGFDMGEEDYELTLDSSNVKLTVSGELEDSSATVEGFGTYDIPIGTTTLPVKVTAESGLEKEYRLHVTREADTKVEPINIKIGGLIDSLCNISEDYCNYNFDPETDTYNIIIPGRINQILFDVEKSHPNQTVLGAGKKDLVTNDINSFDITVTAEDGSSYKTYTYYITRDMSSNANLETLKIIDPNVEINFDPELLEYYFTVPNSYTKIEDYEYKPESSGASVNILGNKDFKPGMNSVFIVVNSQSGDTKIYTLNVYREQNSDVRLSDILVDEGLYPIVPEFYEYITNYKTTVPSNVRSVDIRAVASNDEEATVAINGPSELSPGENNYSITTTNTNDGSILVYTLTVMREKNSNAKLSGITITGSDNVVYGISEEDFDPDTLEYTIEVDSNVTSVDIQPSVSVESTTYKLLNSSNLKTGMNEKRIMVIAEDGSTENYTINIKKPTNMSNLLSDLSIVGSNGDIFDIGFDSNTFEYTLEVENEISYVTIIGTKVDSAAILSGNGKYSLVVGENEPINISVTNDADETKYYSVVITRKQNSNALLTKIKLSSGSIELEDEVYDYNLTVENSVDTIDVTGIPLFKTTTVDGNGTYELEVGENEIHLDTLAEDQVSNEHYTITIKRAKSSNANISSLIMEEGALSPEFKKGTTLYTTKVARNVESGTFRITLEDPSSTYSITGNEFEIGSNIVTITVTADDGTIKPYTVVVYRQELTSNYLLDLEVEGFEISPEFEKTNQYYTLTVPNDVDSVYVKATLEDEDANITGIGSTELDYGENVIAVEVVSLDGLSRSYQIVVTKEPSSETRLAALEIEDSFLSPNFDKDTYEYSLTTSSSALEFTRLETLYEGASVEVIDNSFTENGDYTVIIRVTAADKTTTKDYVLNVEKVASNNNNLASLVVDSYTLTPVFDKAKTLYTLTVTNDVNNVLVEATPEDSRSIVSGDGPQGLEIGENKIVIEVTSESGVTKSYVVVITKEGSSNTNLLDLQVRNGTMEPEFERESENVNFDVEVEYEEESLDLLVDLADDKATYLVSGNKLNVGENLVLVIVTAENGDIKMYYLNVTRKDIVSSLLKDLKVTDYEISPVFNSYVMEYTLEVTNDTSTLEIDAVPLDKNANVVISGNEDLEVGKREITITVTASDNSSEEVYKIYVTKQAYVNNYLNYLYTSLGEVTPEFDKTVLSYSIDVLNDVDTIDLIGAVDDKSSTVEGLGEHELDVGENIFPIVVTSSGGVSRTYYVTVNRACDTDNNLYDLTVKIATTTYALTPEFTSDETDYTLEVPSGTNAINLTARISDKASVEGLGMVMIESGYNDVVINVTSEAGIVKPYTIRVYRPASDNNYLIQIDPSVGTLDPEFSYFTDNYTIKLDSSASLLSFDVITEDDNATVSGNESKVIPDGESSREIVVTSESGTPKTYTFNIIKERTDNAKLSELNIDGYDISEFFDPDVYEYYITVPNEKTVLMSSEVTAVAQDTNAKVQKQNTLNIVTGSDNSYAVKVTAQDGFTTQVYRINITREKGANTLLSSLVVNNGKLKTAFNPNVFTYTWIVSKTSPILTSNSLKATPADEAAKVSKSLRVDAREDDENYIVKVTSDDGRYSSEYTLIPEMEVSSNANLATLELSEGYIEPAFESEIYEYDVYEYFDTESITISGTPDEMDGHVLSGFGEVTLSQGDNNHEIIVEAEDGTKQKYTLNIHRSSLRDTNLNNLGLNGLDEVTCKDNQCELSPEFNGNTTDYYIEVPNEYTNLDVYYETMNVQQTVEILVNDEPFEEYELPLGLTEVVINVYDGLHTFTNTYNLSVYRCDTYDGRLDSMTISDGYFEPDFNSNTYEYDIYEYVDTESIEVSLELKDDTSTITGGKNFTIDLEDPITHKDIIITTFDNRIVTYTLTIHRSILRDLYLADLGIYNTDGVDCSGDKCDLIPDFEPEISNYKVTVPYEYDNLSFHYDTMNTDQKVKVKAEGNYINNYMLPVGKSVVAIEVYDGMGEKTFTYTIEVTRNKPSNYYLDTLTISSTQDGTYTLDPTFRKNIFEYYITVSNEVNEVTIDATLEDNLAKIFIDGYDELEPGENTANLIVTAQDGTIKTYIIHILKLDEHNSYLEDLTIKNGEDEFNLTPIFNGLKSFNYTVYVPANVSSVNILASAYDKDNTVIDGDGEKTLDYGNNVVLIETSNNSSSNTYSLNIIRLSGSNALLKSIKIDDELIDNFDSNTFNYNIEVSDVDSLNLEAIAMDEEATVEILGNNNLRSGQNIVKVVVTSSDLSIVNTYVLNVNKAKSSDISLDKLRVLNGNTPLGMSQSGEYSYNVIVPNDILKVTIEATPASLTSTVVGTGVTYLEQGTNERYVVVTAEDGTEQGYTINIYRQYNLDLKILESDYGTFDKELNSTDNTYTLKVDESVEEVTIKAVAAGSQVTVSGNETYNLSEVTDGIHVIVTAVDGSHKTYTILIDKDLSDNNYLESLVVKDNGIVPDFDKETREYTVNVNDTVTSLDIVAIPESSKAHVDIIGNENLTSSEEGNRITVKVTAENNDTRDYVIVAYLRSDEYFEDLKLSNLSISKGTLNPEFESDTNYYEATVGNSINNLDISATSSNNQAVISGTGNVTLDEGENVFQVVVSKNDKSNVYTIKITREFSSDATLSSLSIKDHEISPIFVKSTIDYKSYVGGDVSEVVVNAIPTDSKAHVSISGNKNLANGDNIIYVTVVSADGSDTKVYTITVNKSISTNAYLKSLSVSDYGFDKDFAKTDSGPYTINVGNNISSIMINAEAEVESTVVSGAGLQTLAIGTNVFKVKATSDSGVEKVYTIIVNKGKNADNTLKEILLSDGLLIPDFDSSEENYSIEVSKNLNSITVTGIANSNTSVVSGNGTYELRETETVIELVVKAEDNSTKKYTLRVIKEHEIDSTKIIDLIVKNGELKSAFNKNVYNYSIEVPYEVENLDYVVTLEDENANYVVTGDKNLKVGTNKVRFTVTNGDNSSVYMIDVIKGNEASNYLFELDVEGYKIVPYFEKQILYYTLEVPSSVNEVNVIATTDDSSSTLTGTGVHQLEYGRNDIYVSVTSNSGVKRTYTISITRVKNTDNLLKTLESDVGEFNDHFDSNVNDYTLTVPVGTEKINLTGTVGDGASVIGLGEVNISKSEMLHSIIVTSEDGKINTYNININRGLSSNNELEYLTPSAGEMSYNNDTLKYDFNVGDNDSIISFDYELSSPLATISGVQVRNLEYGTNEITITVTAEDGTARIIELNITRGKELVSITPEESSIIMRVGEEKDINYTLEPSDSTAEIIYEIADEEILSINDGVVTALKNGNTTIKLKSKDNESINAVIMVNVIETLIESETLDVLRDDDEEPIVIGEEPNTPISTFIEKFVNESEFLHVYNINDEEITDLSKIVGSNMKLKLIIDGIKYDEVTILIRGDFNGDGKVAAIDLAAMNNMVLGLVPTNYINLKIMDLNQDGKVAAVDLAMINNYILLRSYTLNLRSE